MTSGSRASAVSSSSGLTPEEIALRDALARKVSLGSAMAVMPVRQAEVGNRALEATRELLDDRGFLVVVVHGGSDNAKTVWSLTASARFEASKSDTFPPVVLIVKDAHLLPPGWLNPLAQVGYDLAIVAAPVVMPAAAQKMASRRRLRIASILIAPVLASLAIGVFLWLAAQCGVLENGRHATARPD